MKDIWEKLKELYDLNPTVFGVLLFIDLAILYFVIQYFLKYKPTKLRDSEIGVYEQTWCKNKFYVIFIGNTNNIFKTKCLLFCLFCTK